ncbi:uncharacterized protein BX664DRAFT_358352 [Halteromyces radiatus]|uniref:uncharacterized protein n=1 Tax=Halteromyces radiatus TaxID=101107 RepID=UPI0022209321|nr:uncharacterized protein BX664DRAFT_358352 [Halteromyces radiatus]KAI8088697.1 hypothetical protein BX664DRAFT_358352 [Halteromyces radiatus]
MRTLEDAIISETQILVDNITRLNDLVTRTNQEEVLQLIEKLRRVEKKMSLVFTFFQASMYSSNIWQQEEQDENTNRPAFR